MRSQRCPGGLDTSVSVCFESFSVMTTHTRSSPRVVSPCWRLAEMAPQEITVHLDVLGSMSEQSQRGRGSQPWRLHESPKHIVEHAWHVKRWCHACDCHGEHHIKHHNPRRCSSLEIQTCTRHYVHVRCIHFFFFFGEGAGLSSPCVRNRTRHDALTRCARQACCP